MLSASLNQIFPSFLPKFFFWDIFRIVCPYTLNRHCVGKVKKKKKKKNGGRPFDHKHHGGAGFFVWGRGSVEKLYKIVIEFIVVHPNAKPVIGGLRTTFSDYLYAPPHRQDNTYHGLCYTSRGALAGTRNSSMCPP